MLASSLSSLTCMPRFGRCQGAETERRNSRTQNSEPARILSDPAQGPTFWTWKVAANHHCLPSSAHALSSILLDFPTNIQHKLVRSPDIPELHPLHPTNPTTDARSRRWPQKLSWGCRAWKSKGRDMSKRLRPNPPPRRKRTSLLRQGTAP